MPNQRCQLSIRRLFSILFLSSLVLCLSFGHVFSRNWEVGFGQVATAQFVNANQLVKQGVKSYEQQNFQKAVEYWQQALIIYKKSGNKEYKAIVTENLARVNQQIGQVDKAIEYWRQVIQDYKELKDFPKMGQMMTEQAQSYSRIGQHKKAIALLCNANVPDNKEEADDEEPDKIQVCGEESALKIARSNGDWQGEMTALGSLGNAYRLQGNYNQAIKFLRASLGNVDKKLEFDKLNPRHIEDCKPENSFRKNQSLITPEHCSSALNNLGNAYLSRAYLFNTFAKSAKARGATDREREFTKKTIADYKNALCNFEESLKVAIREQNKLVQMQALLNSIRLYYYQPENLKDNNQSKELKGFNPEEKVNEALRLLNKLPKSSFKVYAAIDLANLPNLQSTPSDSANLPSTPESDSVLNDTKCTKNRKLESKAENLLKTAVEIAREIKDTRSESFALGELGHIYECRENYEQALKYTDEARFTADQNQMAGDSLYLWEWQAARIFNTKGEENKTVEAYERAIDSLEGKGESENEIRIRDELLVGGIRGELLTTERNLRFDFRDNIAPLYREFAELKLNRGELQLEGSQQQNDEFSSALNTIDSLRLAELQDYFGEDCVFITFNNRQVDELLDEKTAVFTSIVLKDRTAIIVNLPNPEWKENKKLSKRINKIKWICKDKKTFKNDIEKFLDQLRSPDEIYKKPLLDLAQQLHKDIVKDFTQDLKGIETLVFIQDDLLRSIPMAALYDGNKFLIENYAIAITPSLKLTAPKSKINESLSALILGLSEAANVDGKPFNALGGIVEKERDEVKKIFSGSEDFLDSKFKPDSLKELKEKFYQIIHIATHGEFGTIPEDTFLVTGKEKGQENNGKLVISELEKDIRKFSGGNQIVELLTLTACETAVGDDRSSLGMAGIAVQTGAKSSLASLWNISSEITKDLVLDFYRNWYQKKMSKAQALRKAQKTLICDDWRKCHPYYWSAFTLIGNWL
ncbi:MAG: CHAT domain-containing protein [Cyanobacteria bacterium P01_A01_bin.68]